MQVKINGEKIDLPEGSTIRDAVEASGAPYLEGCVLGLIKGTEEVEQYVNKYKLKTTKGSIIIELLPDAPEELKNTWKRGTGILKTCASDGPPPMMWPSAP